MPYSRSGARSGAQARIAVVAKPFFYAKVRSRKLPTDVRDAIFQNCVFQLSATFEDYLSDLLSGWLSRLQTSGATSDILPIELRAVIVARSQAEEYKRYIGMGNEVELAKQLLSQTDRYLILNDGALIPNLEFRSLIIKDKKFPSPNNLPVLFRRFGIQDIMQRVSRRTKGDFRLALQAFIDVRNALAHESPPSITDLDVARYIAQTDQWIASIDREFYSYVVRHGGADRWV